MINQSNLPPTLAALIAANHIARGPSYYSYISKSLTLNEYLKFAVKRWRVTDAHLIPTGYREVAGRKMDMLYWLAKPFHLDLSSIEGRKLQADNYDLYCKHCLINTGLAVFQSYFFMLLVEPLIKDYTRLTKKPSDIIEGWQDAEKDMEKFLLSLAGNVAANEWPQERIYSHDFHCEDAPRMISRELDFL